MPIDLRIARVRITYGNLPCFYGIVSQLAFSCPWYDFGEPFMLTVAAGSISGRPHGVYSCFIPARRAQVTLNGKVAAGRPFPQQRGDKESSTACLAWSETWVRP